MINKNKLFAYYKRAALRPLAINAILGFILSVTHDGSGYKSDYSTDDGFIHTIILCCLVSASIAILSLTLLLNKFKAIQSNAIYSLLTWFALPVALCLSFGYIALREPGHDLILSFALWIAISHLAGLIMTFRDFRRTVTSGSSSNVNKGVAMSFWSFVFLLMLVANADAQTTPGVAMNAEDTSLSNRLVLAKQWLIKRGMDKQAALIVEGGVPPEVYMLTKSSEEVRQIYQKMAPILLQESNRLSPTLVDSLAVPLALTMSTSDLLECLNSEEGLPTSSPLREKFDALAPKLRKASVKAVRNIGQQLWNNTLQQLTPEEREVLEQALSEQIK